MKAKFEVTLILDVDYRSDVATFLNSLDDERYSINNIKDLSEPIDADEKKPVEQWVENSEEALSKLKKRDVQQKGDENDRI